VKPSASSSTKSSTVPPPAKGAASSSGVVTSGSKTNTSHSNRPFSKTDRSSAVGITNANNSIDNMHTVADIPDHSPKLPPESPIDFKSFIPRPLFASA
jgi:hypothetical protein